MLRLTKYFFIGLIFLRSMVSLEEKKSIVYNHSSIKRNDNLILFHAKQLFNSFMVGSVCCHGSHSSHTSHSSHRSHYSSR
jgi:hypothetical protein